MSNCKRKKIAIMTWHHVSNYGTALQAYALKRVIENNNCEVDLINYERKDFTFRPRFRIKRYLSSAGNYIFKGKKSSQVQSKLLFDDFYKANFSFTHRCQYNDDFNLLTKIYDGFVCGSDQIWGPQWLDGRFFLDFVEEENRKVAYAPSIGVKEIDDYSTRNEMRQWIQSIGSLSAREKTACIILKSISNKDIFNAIDPVLLLTKKEWEDRTEIYSEKEYNVLFFLRNNEEVINKAIEESHRMGVRVVVFPCTQSKNNKYANIFGASPWEFISVIRGANSIYTDSYHAMLFSIIFEKEFFIFEKKADTRSMSQSSRMLDFLSKIDLDMIYNEFAHDKIDYSKVNLLIDEWRKESLLYLAESISNIPFLEVVDCMETDVQLDCCSINERSCEGSIVTNSILSENNQNNMINRFFIHRMEKQGFLLKDECYRCRRYMNLGGEKKLKPIFYDELISRMFNLKKFEILKLYFEFCFGYDLIEFLKKIIKCIYS